MRMRRFAWSCAVPALVLNAWIACAQSVPVVTGDARVDKLLSQMTLEEKLTLIHGTQEDPTVYQGQAGYLGGDSAAGHSRVALSRRASGGADPASLAGGNGHHGRGRHLQRARRPRTTAW